MPLTVSEKIAKKLSRRGWKRGQSEYSYVKRKYTWYDLKKDRYSYGYDAPDIEELRQAGALIGFESGLDNPDDYAIGLIDYLKKHKISKI